LPPEIRADAFINIVLLDGKAYNVKTFIDRDDRKQGEVEGSTDFCRECRQKVVIEALTTQKIKRVPPIERET
jgi:hypothetical protein